MAILLNLVKREIGLKLFGLDGSFPGFRRATTRACLQSLGKRCVLAHALSRLSTHCIVTGPKFLISSVRIRRVQQLSRFSDALTSFAVPRL